MPDLARHHPAGGEPGGPSAAAAAAAQNQAAFTFGTAPTSALELANAMATLADGGTWCPRTPVGSVADRRGAPVELRHEVFDGSASPRPICGGTAPRGCADGDLFGGQAPARTRYRAMLRDPRRRARRGAACARPRYRSADVG